MQFTLKVLINIQNLTNDMIEIRQQLKIRTSGIVLFITKIWNVWVYMKQ